MADPIPMTPIPKVQGESDASAVLRFDTMARFVLAMVIIAQFVLLIGYVIFSGRELPDSQLIIGAEIGMVSAIIQYFYGSSSGSVTKSAKGEPPSMEPPPSG